MVKATVENVAPHNSRTAEGISAQARFIVEVSDLRGHNNIRKAPVVIVSTARRRNWEGKEGRKEEGKYLAFQWPRNNVACSGFILNRY